MKSWYVNEMSKLTKVSVQTLHHYDRLGLLKPSQRAANGYRLYTESDLAKLQQIIALKFFGFSLAQIKMLLAKPVEIYQHFTTQALLLEEKAQALYSAAKTLKNIIATGTSDKSIAWETVIKLIEVYHTMQQLKNTWAGKVFTDKELQQFAQFETELATRFTSTEKQNFEDTWKKLVQSIEQHIHLSPTSEAGIQIAKQVMDLINGLYGKEHANLKYAIWNKGFKTGKIDGEHFLAPEIVAWLDKAMDMYYRQRCYALLDQVKENSFPPTLITQWNALMEEMYGECHELKQALMEMAQQDVRVTLAAKQWLKQFFA